MVLLMPIFIMIAKKKLKNKVSAVSNSHQTHYIPNGYSHYK